MALQPIASLKIGQEPREPRPIRAQVTVVDFDIPMGRMVAFLVRWTIAALLAGVLVFLAVGLPLFLLYLILFKPE